MAVLTSRIDPASKEFATNAQGMEALVADLNARLAEIRLGGGESARHRHTDRGKLLPTARIEAQLDKGADLLEQRSGVGQRFLGQAPEEEDRIVHAPDGQQGQRHVDDVAESIDNSRDIHASVSGGAKRRPDLPEARRGSADLVRYLAAAAGRPAGGGSRWGGGGPAASTDMSICA